MLSGWYTTGGSASRGVSSSVSVTQCGTISRSSFSRSSSVRTSRRRGTESKPCSGDGSAGEVAAGETGWRAGVMRSEAGGLPTGVTGGRAGVRRCPSRHSDSAGVCIRRDAFSKKMFFCGIFNFVRHPSNFFEPPQVYYLIFFFFCEFLVVI